MNEEQEFTRIEIESAQEVAMEYGSGKNKRSGSRVIVKTTDGDTMSLVPWEEGFAASRKALMAGGTCDVVIEQKGEYLNIKAAKAAIGEILSPRGELVVPSGTALPAKPPISQSIPDRTRQILIIRQSCLKAALDLMANPNFPQDPDEADSIEDVEKRAVEIARYFEKQYILAGVKEA